MVLRFVQGLAIGGQWGGATLLVTENAPPEKRGFYGAFAQTGAPVGVILANLAFLGVSQALPESAFMEWGWRLPFLASAALVSTMVPALARSVVDDPRLFGLAWPVFGATAAASTSAGSPPPRPPPTIIARRTKASPTSCIAANAARWRMRWRNSGRKRVQWTESRPGNFVHCRE